MKTDNAKLSGAEFFRKYADIVSEAFPADPFVGAMALDNHNGTDYWSDDTYAEAIMELINNNRRLMSPSRKIIVKKNIIKQCMADNAPFDEEKFEAQYAQIINYARGQEF